MVGPTPLQHHTRHQDAALVSPLVPSHALSSLSPTQTQCRRLLKSDFGAGVASRMNRECVTFHCAGVRSLCRAPPRGSGGGGQHRDGEPAECRWRGAATQHGCVAKQASAVSGDATRITASAAATAPPGVAPLRRPRRDSRRSGSHVALLDEGASMMHSYAHASFLWPRPIALAAVVTGNVVIAAADDAAAHD